jgi:hypothetical protein
MWIAAWERDVPMKAWASKSAERSLEDS